ncbi:single-stranded DNA binding protein Rim1 [Schizosaccharomyces japonicus yFS275]|uniref:Single-stranded DNA binding protein Rim1 n=1 Tax=Schizosaccharomyces japonicus (strain yFS275 / FY16936) TaxID=402676 RepID=B6K5I3_SCHJY|nr:single-stranded DNA binding protein Rim1 [Schizosaccharomyces japonicus yFS275]EEB08787.1 single-stranded DNA binding protein Rim1 [Schizosaccharomyces japonicus yFS275]
MLRSFMKAKSGLRLFSSTAARCSDVQRMTLTGNLVRDLEFSNTADGREFAKYTLSCYNGRNMDPTYHTVFSFDSSRNEQLEKFMKKGAKVFVEADVGWRKVPLKTESGGETNHMSTTGTSTGNGQPEEEFASNTNKADLGF